MANREHLAKLKEGVEAWNDWRKANTEIIPDLREANLIKADLNGADLHGADLTEADLSGADLRWANLAGANLRRGSLREANLVGAAFSGPIARWTALRGRKRVEVSLGEVDLSGADLAHARVGWTSFGDCDLSKAKGLESVQHYGPSTIGIDAIYRSHGNIPLVFLRGAGVPDNFIEYMGSLTGKALEFYSCFISYSTKDQEFADRLYADLQNKGVRCWFAPPDIRGGEHTIDQIDKAIRMHERLLLILSPDSMKSKWVETEIVKARKREVAENKRVLFPVSLVPFEVLRDWKCFDSDAGEDLAREIRKFFIPDFSNWKDHDSYARGFKKLLDGLKAEGLKAA